MKYSNDSTTIRHCGLDCWTLSAPSLTFVSGGIRTLSCGYSLTLSPGRKPAGGRPPRERPFRSARPMCLVMTSLWRSEPALWALQGCFWQISPQLVQQSSCRFQRLHQWKRLSRQSSSRPRRESARNEFGASALHAGSSSDSTRARVIRVTSFWRAVFSLQPRLTCL